MNFCKDCKYFKETGWLSVFRKQTCMNKTFADINKVSGEISYKQCWSVRENLMQRSDECYKFEAKEGNF
jgi:hypothetical protein